RRDDRAVDGRAAGRSRGVSSGDGPVPLPISPISGALAPPRSLDELLETRGIVICCGPGGVGKTTLSASLALRAAILGKKAIVCTIDPAKRLANSLGLSELGNEEVPISLERLRSAGLELKGSLSALMLDTKRQFDALIEKFAKN